MPANHPNAYLIQRLTILWAFNECMLGGIMHAFKIPFTGIFVGGFAVVLIGLIAHFSNNHFRTIVSSTLLVVAVKFLVSPQSPIPAYVAVTFQGLFGALVYKLISNFRIASVLFSLVAMLESVVQKLLIATLLFGKELWVAFNSFANDVAKTFGVNNPEDSGTTLVAIYSSIYCLWGIILGFYLGKLPDKLSKDHLAKHWPALSAAFNNYVKYEIEKPVKKSAWLKKYLIIVVTIVSILVLLSIQSGKSFWVIALRAFAGIFILFFVISPLVRWYIKSKISSANTSVKSQIDTIISELPAVKSNSMVVWKYCSANYKGVNLIRQFFYLLILVSLYKHSNE